MPEHSKGVLLMSEESARSRFTAQLSGQPSGAVIICVVLCLMPAIFALITWQPVFEYTAIRHYSLPVLVAEALIIVVAMVGGFSVFSAFTQLRTITKIASIIWLAAVILATFFASEDPAAAQALCLTVVIHAIFTLAMIDRFSGPWRSARPMVIGGLIAGLALFTVVALMLAWSVPDDMNFDWAAFGGGVSNVRQLGFYGLGLAGLAAGALAARSNPKISDWPVPFLLIGFFLCDWSGGRATFCASIAILICVCLFANRTNRVGFLRLALPLFFLAIPLSVLAAPDDLFGAQTILSRLFGYGVPADANGYSSNRVDIWIETWQGILKQPWLGHGDGQFRHLVEEGDHNYNHPHNSPLQFVYNWGIVGAAALATMLWRPVLNMPKAAREESAIALPAIGALAGLGAASLLDGAFYYPLPVMVSLISLMMLHSTLNAPPAISAKSPHMEDQS